MSVIVESAIAESNENNPILGFEVSHMKCTTILLKNSSLFSFVVHIYFDVGQKSVQTSAE